MRSWDFSTVPTHHMDLHDIVSIKFLKSFRSFVKSICPCSWSNTFKCVIRSPFCCLSCPCMQPDVYSAVLSVEACLDYPLSGSTCSPWGRSLWNPTWWQWLLPLQQLCAPHRVDGWAVFPVLHLTCRCVRRSWSHTSCSARSSTRQTCTRTFPRAWRRGCCTRAHSTAGYSPRVPARCGYILFPESQGSPVFGLRHSNWVICSHTAGPLFQLGFFSGFSLSCVAFF